MYSLALFVSKLDAWQETKVCQNTIKPMRWYVNRSQNTRVPEIKLFRTWREYETREAVRMCSIFFMRQLLFVCASSFMIINCSKFCKHCWNLVDRGIFDRFGMSDYWVRNYWEFNAFSWTLRSLLHCKHSWGYKIRLKRTLSFRNCSFSTETFQFDWMNDVDAFHIRNYRLSLSHSQLVGADPQYIQVWILTQISKAALPICSKGRSKAR